ncbi:MAG TPA: acyl-CoA thioesterase [Casimicrobiaceae bacterium]
MSRSHVSHFFVEFGDCDPAQIVFYPNFFRWMDAASLHFFAAAGVLPWHKRDAGDNIIGTPLVDVHARFIAPATYGDKIAIETSIVEWRRKSFVMKHVVRRGDEVLAEGREIRVFARNHPENPGRIEALPPPEMIRKLFE